MASDSDSDSGYDSLVLRTIKRIKQMCSWPGCDSATDCKIHAAFNNRVKLFQGANESTNDTTRSLLVHPATEDMVHTIYNMDDNISSVGLFSQYIIISYLKSARTTTVKKPISNEVSRVKITALGQRAVKLLTKDITWECRVERDVTYPDEPTPSPNFVNYFNKGRWHSMHVVQRVIDMIFNNMKCHSKPPRNHSFEPVKVLRKLRQAFETNTDGSCGCGRPTCDVQLSLNGVMGISPDRTHDHLGYGDAEQIIKLVCKWHNTSLKHNTIPTRRSCSSSWLLVTTGGIREHYKARMKILKKKTRQSTVEKDQLLQFAHFEAMELLMKKKDKSAEDERRIKEYIADPDHHSTANIKRILIELRRTTTRCWKCLREIIYGDDGDIDIMTLAYVERRASPDRIDNMLSYTGGNMKLVCTSCNFSERGYSRINIDEVIPTKTPNYLLTPELNHLCTVYINELIRIEDTDDSKDVKDDNRREMRKLLFPKPEKVEESEGDEDDE